MLESSYADFTQRKEEENRTKKKEDYEQVIKFNMDLEIEKQEKQNRRNDNVSHGECLKNQITMDKAKKLVEEE